MGVPYFASLKVATLLVTHMGYSRNPCSLNSERDGATPSLTQSRRQLILANAPSTPQKRKEKKRTLSAA